MKKIKTSIALLLTILFTLSAFAAAPTSVSAKGIEKKAKLKLWVPDREVKTAKKLAKSFVKKYKSKKISVKVSAKSEADAGTYLLSDNSSAADVASIANDQLNNLVNAKVISPIKSPKSIKKSMLKSSVSASTLNKKLYAIPRSLNGYCLVYDKSVVSKNQAKTLEGVLQACQSKNKKFIMDAGNGYYSCIFLFTGGLRLKGLKSDFTQKFNKYDINTLTKTLKAFSVLFHKYSSVFRSLAVSNIPADFTSTSTRESTCGAGIDGRWDYEACKAALGKNFGAAKLPTINVNGKNKQIVSMLGYTGYVVNKASKYPKAAQALAKYISTKSAQKKRASKNIVPTNKKLLKSSYISKKPMMKALYKQSKYSVAQTSISPRFWDPFGNLGNKITAKNINPDKYDYKKLIEKTIDNILDM